MPNAPADQAEYHNCADADAAGTTRSHVATIFNAIDFSVAHLRRIDFTSHEEPSWLFSDNAVSSPCGYFTADVGVGATDSKRTR